MPKPAKPVGTKTTTRMSWDHFDVFKGGENIVVTVDGQTLLNYTVQTGKNLRARLSVEGDLEAE